jgi:4-alpha-glucanotransferase
MIKPNHLNKCPLASQWQTIGIRHHHGINVPLFSLHSQHSGGIGEYPDLLPIIGWCKEVGFDVIQTLPLNDTGYETGPYGALSAFALNPIHLGLSRLNNAPDCTSLDRLNRSPRVDYSKVRKLKEGILRQYYKDQGTQIKQSDVYEQFIASNPWLQSYSLFKVLKIERNWQSWEEWPERLKNPSTETLAQLGELHQHEVDFHHFVQFLCFEQLKEVKESAESAHVFLKGDIPILINRESADVWEHRHLFILDKTAGAPPDMYSEKGQKWGFPLYNWTAAERQDYTWWKQRLKVASQLYHIYRLDHIVGFFRIFAIPSEKEPKDGFFLPQDESTWLEHGRKILAMMIENSPMLPIGEDLGIIPNEVRPFLKTMGICGTKVMRWERFWNTPQQQYIPVDEYDPESMTTVSTHDSDTLGGWWKNHPQEAQKYCEFKNWHYSPNLSYELLFRILKDSHHSGSLFHINLLQEYLALFPELVNPNPDEERVNEPGTVSDKNWTYRFKPSVEQIISHESLAQTLKSLIHP